jgi:uncharacterized protein DUF5372
MSGKYLDGREPTPKVGPPSSVTVTHPFHPLHGKKVELVHHPRKPTSKLRVKGPEGKTFYIPRDWTDFEAQQGRPPQAAPDRLLDIRGLRAVAAVISSIKAESSSPERKGGKDP